ncbi:hypothetical protein CI102_12308 [Trichoderma harzianum]|nr:hypothetical protein CI102_12308 [Trichoderma harzianum]
MKHKAILHSDLRCLLEVCSYCSSVQAERARCLSTVCLSGSPQSSTALLFLSPSPPRKTFAYVFMSKFFRLKTASHHFMQPYSDQLQTGLVLRAARSHRVWHDVARRSADICSFGSEQPSYIQAYRHRVFRPLQYQPTLMGALGLFRRHMDSAIFSARRLPLAHFRLSQPSHDALGQLCLCSWPGSSTGRVAEFSVSCPAQQQRHEESLQHSARVLSPSSIYLDPFPFIFGLALSTVNSTESSRASLGN